MSQLYTKDTDGNYVPYIPENKEYYLDVFDDQISILKETLHQLEVAKQLRSENEANFDDDEVSHINQITNSIMDTKQLIESYIELEEK